MTATAPGRDVHGFYAALGIELPGWAQTEAPVRCFADPDAHRREDRDPSCSVNVVSGLFHCHGCGAGGGAYDAAVVKGCSPREAIDLMVAHGLVERRRAGVSRHARDTADMARPSAPVADAPRPRFAVSEAQASVWAGSLREAPGLLAWLDRERGWDRRVLGELGAGFDRARITVPIRDEHGSLQGMLRLRAWDWQQPKVKAAVGTRLGLIPRPAPGDERLVVVEGPGDMLAARSAGLPAVAVPGTDAWRSEWAAMFAERTVTVVMDCDRPGRKAAARIAEDLNRSGAHARIVDLDPRRGDGYDLSDWLRAGNDPRRLTAPWYENETHTPIARDRPTVQAPRPTVTVRPVSLGGRGPGWPAC